MKPMCLGHPEPSLRGTGVGLLPASFPRSVVYCRSVWTPPLASELVCSMPHTLQVLLVLSVSFLTLMNVSSDPGNTFAIQLYI